MVLANIGSNHTAVLIASSTILLLTVCMQFGHGTPSSLDSGCESTADASKPHGSRSPSFFWRRAVSHVHGRCTAIIVSKAELVQLPLDGATMYLAVFMLAS